MFRPCIDLHAGRVKQIVGGTLTTAEKDTAGTAVVNFESDKSSEYYAELYKGDGLLGGHVIKLGSGNDAAAKAALRAYPGGLQVGGGITADNAMDYLDAGASHIIVTSYVFREGRVDFDRLKSLVDTVGKNRLVLDLSCRKHPDTGMYHVVTDLWQKFTDVEVNPETIRGLAGYCAEFLVHGVDVEGKQAGVEDALIEMLGEHSTIPVTYAGGVATMDDLNKILKLGKGRVAATVGSALDIFGGKLPYADVVLWSKNAAKTG